jgi:hypothetical protein
MNGNRAVRTLSFSEITAAITCPARWDFAYGGRLAGSALRRRAHAVQLSDGKAWGAAVAAWHAFQDHDTLESVYDPPMGRMTAHVALREAYADDIAEQMAAGVYLDPAHEAERVERLSEILEHCMVTAEKMPNLTLLEDRFEVPILSRGGRHLSTKYRLEGYIDGFTVLDGDEGEWIVEFKLRGSLTPRKYLTLSRQHLWYAWARSRTTRRSVVGVIIDERLNEVPKPARAVIQARRKDGVEYRPSAAIDEMTTPESYLELCEELGAYPKNHEEKLAALKARRWHQREQILFRPGQLQEAGRELVSAGMLIADLERGDRYPIRNGQRLICQGCRYSDICANPQDTLYVDTLFERTPPKRERQKEAVA